MALILCLETSSKNCSVSISENGKNILFKEKFDETYCHGEQLHVLIEGLLIEGGISINDFDAFAFSAGPGSYTGLRIGAATVKGFAFALDKPIISISTLNSMAFGFLSNSSIDKKKYDLFCPVLDSRKGEVYLAMYDNKHNEHLKPFSCDINSFPFSEYLDNKEICFWGPGKYKLESIINHKNAIFDTHDYPSANNLPKLVERKFKKKDFVDTAYFEPLYLKNFIPTKSKKGVLNK